MNTTKIEEFVNKLAETGSTLLDNAPSYIHEYLSYCFMINIFQLIGGLVLILAPFIVKILLPTSNDSYCEMKFLGKVVPEIAGIFLWIFSGAFWIIAPILIIGSIIDMIAIKYYPTAYLIQEILGHKCK